MTTFVPPSYDNAPDTTWCTADLCDLALNDPTLELRILPPAYRTYGGRSWYFGEIVTVDAPRPGGAMSLAPLLSQPGNNRVLLVDAQGSPTQAILGDRMAAMAVQNGWSGIVIHGYVRDTRILARMPVGVHALGSIPTRAAEMPPAAAAPQVTIHGHRVKSGEWLYADEDGVIVLARRHTAA
ncbi:ribonuclease E activity regulator RraA [Bordetella sp. 02P26C-1]|uniref:ribonuclease E activity regulator RraA n=1 Tax=Bordetella sp. 02P26C-1 TaxID=2683195 RepID=UPI001355C2EC|nr:ribonuclease E activity regulator RraA [Bordetella sp. 02P26C-1]MVW78283.1 ribonuclease E activity regulator RraA [Bordetella sp. 02P26C-1]